MDEPVVPINSIKRSYEIVGEIRDREGSGATELSGALDLPKSTVHNHLKSLEALGYLVKRGGEYRLSTQFLHLGRESRNSNELFIHGRQASKALADETNTYSQLVVEENGRGAILLATRWEYEDLPPSARHVYPTHEHLHTNAPGKAILSAFTTDRVEKIVARHGLPGRTEKTLTALPALREELSTVREQGYAVDTGEMIPGIVGVAAPVATDDRVYGALAAYGPASDLRGSLDGDLSTVVREKAAHVRDEIVFATMD
ncbi:MULTISPECIES: IclR family transcriptional regulator [unclassified Haladaptatus]|uniref:IclR family transcriptional regulator n=1 Tax=unclassified Haladaptatus TaxID=2622732 RepID=UPI0023E8CA58|nr:MULTISPECIES: IclR family transcriptional regulator [unclassified Haladaptatus]